MFTGIIEALGKVEKRSTDQSNLLIELSTPFLSEIKIDQSIAHNGVCLTVVQIFEDRYRVTAIEETLLKSNLRHWKVGDEVNLERCLQVGGRLDGHMVQGHVDQIGIIEEIQDQDGSKLLTINYDPVFGNITVEKGSICLNGISLTVLNSGKNHFSVAIIPYTWEHTNLKTLDVGAVVNLEFDILGKYIKRLLPDS